MKGISKMTLVGIADCLSSLPEDDTLATEMYELVWKSLRGPDVVPVPAKTAKRCRRPATCGSCGHGAHEHECSGETYNGYSCGCRYRAPKL